MANNLSPELLARLRGYNYTNEGSYYDPQAGRWYTPEWTQTGVSGQGQDAAPQYALTGWRGYDSPQSEYGADPSRLNGRAYDVYDASGQQTGGGAWSGIEGRSVMDDLLPLAMVAAPFAMSMFPALGSAASFGANPVLSGASATGATQALGAGGALAGAGGAGGAGYGMSGGLTEPAASIGMTGGLTEAELAAMGAGGAGTAGGAGYGVLGGATEPVASMAAGSGAGGGLLGAAGAAGKLLGPAAAILGAAAGAKGQQANQTTARDIPEWLKPSVMGLLGQTDALLARQTAPGALAGYDDMQRLGRGLLNAPVAGNGFGLFQRGR